MAKCSAPTLENPSRHSIPCSACKRECLVELISTYLLVLLGPASVVVTTSRLSTDLTPFESIGVIGSCFGLVVGGSILLFGRLSTPQMNPAITLAGWLTGKVRKQSLIPLTVFQVSGGLFAGLTLRLIFTPINRSELGSTMLSSGVTPLDGVILEALGTCALTVVALTSSTRFHERWKLALALGITLFSIIILLGPLTGASLNPVRSLGPALASGYVKDLYVFILGPLLGGSLGAIAFQGLMRENKSKV